MCVLFYQVRDRYSVVVREQSQLLTSILYCVYSCIPPFCPLNNPLLTAFCSLESHSVIVQVQLWPGQHLPLAQCNLNTRVQGHSSVSSVSAEVGVAGGGGGGRMSRARRNTAEVFPTAVQHQSATQAQPVTASPSAGSPAQQLSQQDASLTHRQISTDDQSRSDSTYDIIPRGNTNITWAWALQLLCLWFMALLLPGYSPGQYRDSLGLCFGNAGLC